MKTSEILNKSADEIEARGWTQGRWGGEGQPLCLEGGILAAMGTGKASNGEPLDFQEMWACPAYRAVQNYLYNAHRYPEYVYGEEHQKYGRMSAGGGIELWRFNDAAERTAEEVIEVLRAVAVIEEAREQAEIEVPA